MYYKRCSNINFLNNTASCKSGDNVPVKQNLKCSRKNLLNKNGKGGGFELRLVDFF